MVKLGTKSITTLTAPGGSTVLEVGNQPIVKLVAKVTVASINTNVVIRFETDESTSFSAVTGQTLDETITANGTYLFDVPVDNSFVRLNFVSEAGGTAATVACDFILYSI